MTLRLALLLTLPATPPAAQMAQTNLRYDEAWVTLRGTPNRDARWWERLKARPIAADGDVYVTLGAEARARYEGFAGNNWGQPPAPDDGYLWLRLMPLADVHAGPVRAFVQGIAGYAHGVGAGAGPADQTGLDVLQAFADVRLPLGSAGSMTVRGGRELVALGSERLVGLRYGPNIPQAFDGVRLTTELHGIRMEALRFRPAAVQAGTLDDRTSTTKRLAGFYATLAVGGGAKADLYWLAYRDDLARFGGTTARERRDTYGLRFFGRSGTLGWNWEAMVQRGRFGTAPISAWSLATETSVALDTPLSPRLRLRADIASGDRDSRDGRLGTFNALFPKGKYFGELSPIGPRNIIDLHPSVDFDLGDGITAGVAAAAFWRVRRGDGVYDVPGRLVRAAGDGTARHIGHQIEMSASWQASPILSVSASASDFTAGAFLRQTGAARPIRMIGAETMLRF